MVGLYAALPLGLRQQASPVGLLWTNCRPGFAALNGSGTIPPGNVQGAERSMRGGKSASFFSSKAPASGSWRGNSSQFQGMSEFYIKHPCLAATPFECSLNHFRRYIAEKAGLRGKYVLGLGTTWVSRPGG